MLKYIHLYILFLVTTVSHTLVAQSTWLLAESIDKNNLWNESYYKPFNSADNLVVNRTDSTNFCTDCSLPNALWKGIESGKITAWQLSKKSFLVPQKYSSIKNQLLNQVAKINSIASIQEALTSSEVTIYRKPLNETAQTITELPIEWIALKIPFEKDTSILYLKAVQCIPFLNTHTCKWVLPSNYHSTLNMGDALIQRKYVASKTTHIVASVNLQQSTSLKKNIPTLFQTVLKNTPPDLSTENTDTLYIRLQAMYSASITSTYNRGLNKAHLIEYLLTSQVEQKITAYNYHPEGYFTKINKKEITNHLLVETIEDEEYVAKRYSSKAFTRIHVLKTLTKISSEERISTDWFIIGMDTTLSTNVYHTHAIAFKYQDVIELIRTTNMMWYNGLNEKDSVRLDVALQKDYIDYDAMVLSNIYGDTIASCSKYPNWIEQKGEQEPMSILYSYGSNLIKSFKGSTSNIPVSKNKNTSHTYYLTYQFTPGNTASSSTYATLVDALMYGVQHKKIGVYTDPKMEHKTTLNTVLNKLDKSRFYKTGNSKKDSIYISKIPLEERYIKTSELSDYELISMYTSNGKKSINTGLSFGVFIPAELNPQYEPDTLCYVSYGEFLSFLQKSKAYKKMTTQLESLLNQHSIILATDFYDIVKYDASNENSTVWSDLPEYVRERCLLQSNTAE